MNKELEYKKKLKKKKINIFIIQLSLLFFVFILWEILGRFKIINTFLFSYPSDIIKIFYSYLKTFEIFRHIGISLLETFLGLVIGSILGLVIAVVLWWNELLSKVFDPFLVVLNALPKTALAPIIINFFLP